MKNSHLFSSQLLSDKGLNLQAVFNISDLPEDIIQSSNSDYSQLLLIAHGGQRMWQALKETNINSNNPVDDFSTQLVEHYFKSELPKNKFEVIYPSSNPIGLRKLGELAGWHHDSPFRIGINADWGSWFAYRAVILADTNFKPTEKKVETSPCEMCNKKACISACPANAMQGGSLLLDKCISYRKEGFSHCKNTCLSRVACPVAPEHHYTEEQINYHYSVSLKTINEFY